MRYEQHIIGGLLKGVITSADLKLTAADFDDLGAAFSVIRQIETEGLKPDAKLLYQRTAEIDSLSWYSVKDFEAFAEMPVSASSCLSAAKAMRSVSLKDDLTAKTSTLFVNAEKMTGAEILRNLKEIISESEYEYSEVKGGFKSLKEIAPKVAKVYSDLHQGISYSVPTGFSHVDDAILDGFSRGDEHLIVGFTGAGKSSLALTFARNQARSGYTVGIVSREMSDIENVIRLQVAETNTPRWYIRKGLHDVDYERLSQSLEDFSELPIFVNSETSTVEDLRSQVKMLVETEGLSILYVDYLQLLGSSENHSSRANEVQKVSRTLKEIAMENNIPVVSLCQFNRGALQSSVFEIMYQLKESSGLEQDASTILFVEVEQTQEMKQTKSASVTVLKNRNGTPFVPVQLEFVGELFTFRQVD